jgi:hypothetical protein
LAALGGDHADRRDPDLLVDAMLLLDGSRLPDAQGPVSGDSVKKRNSGHDGGSLA